MEVNDEGVQKVIRDPFDAFDVHMGVVRSAFAISGSSGDDFL